MVADAQKVKGLAPLACKTDKIDALVLAELSWRDLVPAIWLPGPSIRRERELARYRLHLVRHRTTLKNRIHATLMTFGTRARSRICSGTPAATCSTTSPFPIRGADRRREPGADRRPRIADRVAGPINAYTVASEIGDIERSASPAKLVGYTGLCPRVYQSARHRPPRPISKQGGAVAGLD